MICTYAPIYLPLGTLATFNNNGRYSIVTFEHCWTQKMQKLQGSALVDK